MNIFRFIADMLHLSAILILLYRIKNNRNCIGKYNDYYGIDHYRKGFSLPY
jgi:hypothetical protein